MVDLSAFVLYINTTLPGEDVHVVVVILLNTEQTFEEFFQPNMPCS